MHQPIAPGSYLTFSFLDYNFIGKVIDFKWNGSGWDYLVDCAQLTNVFWIPGNAATYIG